MPTFNLHYISGVPSNSITQNSYPLKPVKRGYEPGTRAYGLLGTLVFAAAGVALSVVTFGLATPLVIAAGIGAGLVGGGVIAGLSELSVRNRDKKLIDNSSVLDAFSTKRAARHGLTLSTLLAVVAFTLAMTIPGLNLGLLAAGLIAGATFLGVNTAASLGHVISTMGRRGRYTAMGLTGLTVAAAMTGLVLGNIVAASIMIGLAAGLVTAGAVAKLWLVVKERKRLAKEIAEKQGRGEVFSERFDDHTIRASDRPLPPTAKPEIIGSVYDQAHADCYKQPIEFNLIPRCHLITRIQSAVQSSTRRVRPG